MLCFFLFSCRWRFKQATHPILEILVSHLILGTCNFFEPGEICELPDAYAGIASGEWLDLSVHYLGPKVEVQTNFKTSQHV